jgi:signal transduction histidine kinase
MYDLIREAEPALQMKAADKHLRLITRCVDGDVQMDPDLIKVLIYNLVDNAVKASTEAGIITIQSQAGQGFYALEVIDHGIGIPEEHLTNLFEPFYMVDKARTKSQHGAGLGLSIYQSIAEVHGARLEVESTPGEGTTMRVVFPLQGGGGGERE